MVPDLQSPDRMGAIKEMVDRLHRAGCVTDSLAFLQSVLDREDLESTVLEKGVAFPHARCRSTTRLDVAFGISRQGVDFHSERYPQHGQSFELGHSCRLVQCKEMTREGPCRSKFGKVVIWRAAPQ
jgi:hypothetical protein